MQWKGWIGTEEETQREGRENEKEGWEWNEELDTQGVKEEGKRRKDRNARKYSKSVFRFQGNRSGRGRIIFRFSREARVPVHSIMPEARVNVHSMTWEARVPVHSIILEGEVRSLEGRSHIICRYSLQAMGDRSPARSSREIPSHWNSMADKMSSDYS